MAIVSILPFAIWLSGTNQNSVPANDNSLRHEILNGLVISKTTTAQPLSPADGAIYIIPAGATGAQWSLLDADDLVIFKGGTWYAFAPVPGVVVNFDGEQEQYAIGSPGGWSTLNGGGSSDWADLTGIPAPIADIAALTDPGADRLLFWDDSVGIYTHLELGTNLSIAGTTLNAAGGGGASAAGSDKQVQFNDGGAFGAETGFEYDKTSNTLTVDKLNEARSTAIASATTTDIGAAGGNFVHVTGTTTITGLGTVAAGARRIVVFDGALTITHNATSLILPTGANITTAAGDSALCISEGSGNWRVVIYQKKDGTALASGGSGLTNWTDGINSSTPNATVPVVSFSATNAATDVDAAFIPKGAGAITAAIPNNLTTGGNKRGTNAVDFQMLRSSAAYIASGARSVVPGGQDNLASGAESYAMGKGSQASGSQSGVLAGISNRASGPSSVVTHGEQNLSDATYSRSGGAYGATRGVSGADVWGNGGALGTSQRGTYMLRRQTSNATPDVMTALSNSASPSTANQLTLPDNSAYTFTGMVVAKRSGSTDTKHWTFVGGILRGSGAGTVALIAAVTPVVVGGAAGMSALSVTVSVDTTLGCLKVGVVGDAFTVNWSCSVETCEVTG